MPRPKSTVPAYCRHKASNQAYVTIGGRERYLGPYGSPESREAYARLIASGLPAELKPAHSGSRIGLSINQLVLEYWNRHARIYHANTGKPTERQYHVRLAFRPLCRLYGNSPVTDFGPVALQLVREDMIEDGVKRRGGLNRHYVNDHIKIIVRMFRWAVSAELVSLSVYQSLATVEPLHKGRDPRVREKSKIRPVPQQDIEAVLPVVSHQIRAMIELQLLTGMRPDEVTIMRPCDIDRVGDVWIYSPISHKLAYRGSDKLIPIGPKGQRVLGPFLDREDTEFLFSPGEAYAAAVAETLTKKKKFTTRKRKNKALSAARRSPREHYDDDSYRQAVERGCKRAGVPKWTPGRLRHNAGTELRQTYGIEAARTILGHGSISTTEIYAEKDFAEAIRIMREVG